MKNPKKIQADLDLLKKVLADTTDAEEKEMLKGSIAELEAELAKANEKPAKEKKEEKPKKEKAEKKTKEPKAKKIKAEKKQKVKEPKVEPPKATGKKSEIADKTVGKTSETKFGNLLHVKSEDEYTLKNHKNEKQIAAITWNESKGHWDIDCCEIGDKHPKFSKKEVEEAIYWVEDFWACMETMRAKHEQVKKSRARAKARSKEGKPAVKDAAEAAKDAASEVEKKVKKAGADVSAKDVKTIAREFIDAILVSAKHAEIQPYQEKMIKQASERYLKQIDGILGKKKMDKGGKVGKKKSKSKKGGLSISNESVLEHAKYIADKEEIELDAKDKKEAESFLDKSKGKIEFGKFFDYKEEKEMEEYIAGKKEEGWKHAYNAYVGGDGWQVVLSKVEIKGAEKI